MPSPWGPCIARALLDRGPFSPLAWDRLCLAAPTVSECFNTRARPVNCVAWWTRGLAKKNGNLGILQTARDNRLVSGEFFHGGVEDGRTEVHRKFEAWRGVAWASSTYLKVKVKVKVGAKLNRSIVSDLH